MARPFFSKDRIADFDIFERTSGTALCLVPCEQHGRAYDVQDLVSRFTLDSASEFLFGVKLNTLAQPLVQPGRAKLGPKGAMPIDGKTEFDSFTEAFEEVAVLITRRGAKGIVWPLSEPFHDKTQEAIDVIFNWIDPLVQHALQRRTQMDDTSGDDEGVFLDFLAKSTDGELYHIYNVIYSSTLSISDVEHIRYELITYLIASRDTVYLIVIPKLSAADA